MAIVGSAYVEIHTITKAVSDEIRDGLREAIRGQGKQTGKTYGEEFGKESGDQIEQSTKTTTRDLESSYEKAGTNAGRAFADRFTSLSAAISKNIPKANVDTSALEAKITSAQAKLDQLYAKRNDPQIDFDIAAATARLDQLNARLRDLRDKPTTPRVEADIASAQANIAQVTARLERLNREKANPRVEADITQAEANLRRMSAQLNELSNRETSVKIKTDESSFTETINNVALLGRSLAQLAVPVAIIAATPAVASLGAAAVDAAGALYLLPALLTGTAAAAATLVIGFEGVATALGPTGTSAQLKKVNEALAEMAPNAREVVGSLRELGPAWHELRLDVQQRLFADLAGIMLEVGQQYIPILTTALGGVAEGFNLAAAAYGRFLLEPSTLADFSLGMANVEAALRSIAKTLEPLARAFNDIFVVGSGYLPGYAANLNDLANQFANFISNARATGELNTMIEEGVGVLGDLGGIAKSSGGILNTVFDAATASGSNTVKTAGLLTEQLDAFLKSAEGNSALVTLFTTINQVVAQLQPGLDAIFIAVAEGVNALGPALPPLAQSFATIVISLAPLIADLAKMAAVILPPLASILQTLGPLFGPVAAGFLAMYAVSALAGMISAATASLVAFAIAQGTTSAALLANVGLFGATRAALLSYIVAQGGATVAAGAGVGVIGTLSLAFHALKLAILANPIVIIVTALVGLGAALIYAYNHFEGFRAVVDSVFKFVTDTVMSVVNFFTGPFVDGVVGAVNSVISFFTNFPQNISNAISGLGTMIAETATNAWNWLVTTAQDAGANVLSFLADLPMNIAYALGSLVGTLVRVAIDGWAGFVTGITTAVANTIIYFQELPGRFVAGLTSLGASLAKTAQEGGEAFRQSIVNGFIAVVTFFTTFPGRARDSLISLGITLLASAAAGWAGFTQGITDGWNGTVEFFTTLPARVGAFFDSAGTWLTTAGNDILAGLIGGLVSGANAVGQFFTDLVNSFMQGFRDSLGISSPSTVFADFGRFILEGLLGGLQALGQMVIDFITNLGVMITTAFTAAIDFLVGLWTTFWQGLNAISGGAFDGVRVMIESVWAIIVSIFTTFVALITGDWDGFWAGLKGTADAIWNAIQTYLSMGMQAFSNIFGAIWNGIQVVFTTVWNAISTVATTVWTFIAGFFTTAFNFYVSLFTTIWNTVSTIFSTVWKAIQDIATTVWNAISSFFTGAFNAFTSFFTGVWNAIAAVFTLVWERNRDFAIMIWNAIASFFTAAFNTFKSAFETIWNAISTFFSGLWTGIRNMVTGAWNGIQSFFTGALATFKSGWDSFWSGISTAFGNLWSGIRSVAESAWRGIQDMFRGGINLVIDAVNWPVNQINGALGINIPTINRLATGGTTDREGVQRPGRVSGIGSTTSDAHLTRLSREEHVWSAAEVRAAGGHDAVRRMRAQVMSGYSSNIAPGQLASAMASRRVNPDSYGGRSVAQGLRRRQLMEKFPRLDDVGIVGLAPGGVQPHVARASDAVEAALGRMPGGVGGLGSRPGPSDHPSGHALDFMTLSDTGLGDRVADFLIGQSQQLAVKYLIWKQAINNGGGWDPMEDRGSITANHFDHVHASFLRAGQAGQAFSGAGSFFDPGAMFDAAAAAIGLPEASRNFTRSVMPDDPNWLEPMGVSFHDKGWEGMRATAIKFLEALFSLGGLFGGGPGKNAGGPGLAKATGPVADQVRMIAAQRGWDTGPEWNALSQIIAKESSWDPNAANPNSSARGLFQKMTSLHGPVEPTAAGQAQWGVNYIADRYGTPTAALAHHNRVGSYDRGGWLKPGITQAINGTGKPEAIIADPMTTFEKSFKTIFKWLAPNLRDALMQGIDRLDDVVKNNGGQAPNWLGKILERFRSGGDGATGGTGPNIPPVIPPPVIPPIVIPPPVVPKLPAAEFGVVFQDILSQLAPELSLALKAGSNTQISQFAKEIAANPERISAISAAMSEVLGTPVTNISTVLNDLIASVAAPEIVIPPVMVPQQPGTSTPSDTRWLEQQFARFREVIAAQQKTGSNAGDMLARFAPKLAADFYKAFPDVQAATKTGAIDVNRTLTARADDILAYLATKSQEDASDLIGALSGRSSTFTGANKTSATDLILSTAQSTVAPGYATTPPPASMSIGEGAFQVTIQGNADAVTVAQLQETLETWGEEIMHEYEGRT